MPVLAGFLGGNEIMWIALVIIVLFGAAAIPKFARNIGRARKEFQKGLEDESAESGDESADNPESADQGAKKD